MSADYKKATGYLIVTLVIAVTIILQQLRLFDIMASIGEIWIWVAAILLGVASNLLTKQKSSREIEVRESEEHPGVVERPGMVLNDRAITELTKMARRGYKDTLKLNLDLIGQELNGGRIPPKLISWDETEPELRKGLITSKPEYDALDDFAKSLTQCPRRDEPNFDVMSNLCKTHYERLKRLGLAS